MDITKKSLLNFFSRRSILCFFILLLCSTVYDYTSTFDFRWTSWITRILIWSICSVYIFLRFVIRKDLLSLVEKLFGIVFMITFIFTPLLNRQFGFRSFYEPFFFLLVFIGIFSMIQVSDYLNINHILMFFLFIALFHLCLTLIVNFPYIIKASAYASNLHYRIGRFFKNPNDFGFLMMGGVLSASGLCYDAIQRKKKVHIIVILGILLFLCMLGILLSSSRASILGGGVYIVILIAHYLYNEKKNIFTKFRLIYIMLFCSIVIGGLIFLYCAGLLFIIIEKFSTQNFSLRIAYWLSFLKEQVSLFPDLSVFLGKGYYGVSNSFDPSRSLHNVYLEIWARYGLLSLLVLAVAHVYMLYKGFAHKRVFYVWAMFFAFLVHQCFEVKLFFGFLRPVPIFYKIVLLFPFLYRKHPDKEGKTLIKP